LIVLPRLRKEIEMPTFEYICRDCRTVFEKIMAEAGELPNCPGCKSGKTQKRVTIFAYNVEKSPNRSADSIIGAAAEHRWEQIKQENQKKADMLNKAEGRVVAKVSDERPYKLISTTGKIESLQTKGRMVMTPKGDYEIVDDGRKTILTDATSSDQTHILGTMDFDKEMESSEKSEEDSKITVLSKSD